MKYKVIGEDGLGIRLFATKTEAVAFLQSGWSISRMPIKRKPTAFELVGDCLF
jgi:hypothetical protein